MAKLCTLLIEAYDELGYHGGATILLTEEEAYLAKEAGLVTIVGNASVW